jgi:hypothetical protein
LLFSDGFLTFRTKHSPILAEKYGGALLRRPESDPKCAMRPPMSKGRKKPKLRDLSVNPLTYEEQTALIDAVAAAAHPINSAILGAVLVEHELLHHSANE